MKGILENITKVKIYREKWFGRIKYNYNHEFWLMRAGLHETLDYINGSMFNE